MTDSFQTQGIRWIVIFGGAVLGVSAGLLWSAQGSILMSYPPEKDRGKAFGVFWAIFQSGTLLGSIVALAINIRSGGTSAVSTATYIVGPVEFDVTSSLRWGSAGVSHHHLHGNGLCLPHFAPEQSDAP